MLKTDKGVLTSGQLLVLIEDLGQAECVRDKVAEVVQGQQDQTDAMESKVGMVIKDTLSISRLVTHLR